MAYIKQLTNGQWFGPLANKAGEWNTNGSLDNLRIEDGMVTAHYDEGTDPMDARWVEYPNPTLRAALPSSCPGGTSEQVAKMGLVGLYLMEDDAGPLAADRREIDTDVLHEDVVSGRRPPRKPFIPDVPMDEHSLQMLTIWQEALAR